MSQCHISESLVGLDFRSRYGLREYFDSIRPLVIFGMYRVHDLSIYMNHKSDVILVWTGSDAKNLTPEWAYLLKSREAKHYSISHWIKGTLDLFGIESELKPITPTIANLKPIGKGNSIHFYSSNDSEESANVYGEFMLDEIKTKTGFNVIRTAYGLYPKESMPEIYSQCFINLRLTEYDGCPNGVLEMGMMGIPSIFNGDIPGSIKWKGVDDICESIKKEFDRKDEPTNLHNEIYKFLNIKFP